MFKRQNCVSSETLNPGVSWVVSGHSFWCRPGQAWLLNAGDFVSQADTGAKVNATTVWAEKSDWISWDFPWDFPTYHLRHSNTTTGMEKHGWVDQVKATHRIGFYTHCLFIKTVTPTMSRFLRVQTTRSSAVSLFQADFESSHVVRSSGCSANQSLVIGNALATQLLFHWQWYVMIAMIGNDNNANHHVPHMNIYIYLINTYT